MGYCFKIVKETFLQMHRDVCCLLSVSSVKDITMQYPKAYFDYFSVAMASKKDEMHFICWVLNLPT